MLKKIILELNSWFLSILANIPGVTGSKLRACYWSKSSSVLAIGTGTHVTGRKNVQLGNQVSIANNCLFDSKKGRVSVGENSHFNQGVMVLSGHGEIIFGKNLLVGPYVVFRASNHNYENNSTAPVSEQGHKSGKIIIGNNVWIGAHCTILPGADIGDNCVIGAGAVVNSTIPSNTMAGGIPAKVIKTIDNK